MRKVIVLGAGVIGVVTAYYLTESGFDVTVVDSADAPAKGTSFANGAQLSYSKTYPLSNLKTLKSLPAQIFDKKSAIHIKKLDYELIKWGGQFVYESFRAKQNAAEILQIGLRSRELMHAITQRHEINFDYARAGKLFVFTKTKDFEHAKKVANEYNNLGVEQKILSPQEAIGLEPALAAMQNKMVGAIYSSIDESGDAKLFCDELIRILTAQGVKFIFNKNLDKIENINGEIKSIGGFAADYFVCCLGIGSNNLLNKIGIHLPIYPMKGYSLTVPAANLAPQISITDEAHKVVYSKIGNRLRIAGIAEFDGYNTAIDNEIVNNMLNIAKSYFPAAADYNKFEAWTGLRPMTPSTIPIIERTNKFKNLFINTGHGMLGWTLATASAEKLVQKLISSA